MHKIELYRQAVEAAEQLGYTVRHEWLDGRGGGACEFSGQKWIFVDLALDVEEQLDQVIEALHADPAVNHSGVSTHVQKLVQLRKAA